MELVNISENGKKTIIWNFMEELWENYVNAIENNLPTQLNFMDFFNFGALKNGFSENDKISVIKEYAREKGYIKIKGNTVGLTKKGLKEFQKDLHEWNMNTLKRT